VLKQSEQLKIFIVDDELIIASTLATILQHNGFDAIAFTRPAEVLKAARLAAPSLVVSDVEMPLLSGLELANLLKRYCPECRILLFSGRIPGDNLFQVTGEDGHEFEFLSKPIRPMEFVRKIKAMTEDIMPLTAIV
jgi:FixJ family two-component response regulator